MKVLILGSSGMLGYSLFKNLNEIPNIQTFGTIRSHEKLSEYFSAEESERLLIFDVLDTKKTIQNLLEKVKPEYVLNCIGLISQKNSNYVDVLKLNSIFPHELERQCSKASSTLIHFSTDCVFSGSKGFYNEDDFADADDLYGRSKFLGEINKDQHLTIRTSIIGHELKTDLSLIDWFLSQEDSVNGFKKAIFSGFPCCYITEILVKHVFSNNKARGLLHISSDPISKFDLLSKIALVYKKKIEIFEDTDYVTDKTLDSSKFKSLTGFVSPQWDDLINKMYIEYCKIHKN